ncbi:hypothetical protein B296_00048629, partial [Ensete ventricosum]
MLTPPWVNGLSSRLRVRAHLSFLVFHQVHEHIGCQTSFACWHSDEMTSYRSNNIRRDIYSVRLHVGRLHRQENPVHFSQLDPVQVLDERLAMRDKVKDGEGKMSNHVREERESDGCAAIKLIENFRVSLDALVLRPLLCLAIVSAVSKWRVNLLSHRHNFPHLLFTFCCWISLFSYLLLWLHLHVHLFLPSFLAYLRSIVDDFAAFLDSVFWLQENREREVETLNRARQLVLSNERLVAAAAVPTIPPGDFQHGGDNICEPLRPVYPIPPTQSPHPPPFRSCIGPSMSSLSNPCMRDYDNGRVPTARWRHQHYVSANTHFACFGVPLANTSQMDGVVAQVVRDNMRSH